jgi:uncharacterized protein YjgD (DUF1641 family)
MAQENEDGMIQQLKMEPLFSEKDIMDHLKNISELQALFQEIDRRFERSLSTEASNSKQHILTICPHLHRP